MCSSQTCGLLLAEGYRPKPKGWSPQVSPQKNKKTKRESRVSADKKIDRPCQWLLSSEREGKLFYESFFNKNLSLCAFKFGCLWCTIVYLTLMTWKKNSFACSLFPVIWIFQQLIVLNLFFKHTNTCNSKTLLFCASLVTENICFS